MRGKTGILIGVVVGVVVVGGVSVALSATGFTSVTGSAITQVRVLTGETGYGADGVGIASQTFTTMPTGCCDSTPWAQTTMTVPSGTSAFFIVTVESNGDCFSSTNGFCLTRLTVNGVESEVTVWDEGSSVALDPGFSHSVTFTTDKLPAGTYKLAAQWATSDTSTEFFIDSNKVIVERVRV